MPDSLLISGSEVDRHLTDWLGNDGTFLIRHKDPVETVIRYASIEDAQEALADVDTEEADEGELIGPFTSAECLSTFLSRIDQTSPLRFTQWLELAVEVEPFQVAFHDGLTARLQLLHLDRCVPCTWGTTTINIQIHVTRESMDQALNGTLRLQAGTDTQSYATAQLDLEFGIGVWDQYIFHTFQFSPRMGPCRLSILLGDTSLDSVDIEIVDDMPAVVPESTEIATESHAEIAIEVDDVGPEVPDESEEELP
jgi:hypothetical protein